MGKSIENDSIHPMGQHVQLFNSFRSAFDVQTMYSEDEKNGVDEEHQQNIDGTKKTSKKEGG